MTTERHSDLLRTVSVAVLAVLQVISSPLTTLALGPSSNTGAISDANNSPVTPAGYAFAIWGLIYTACLALAVYQLLPSQRSREVHRRTGWWLVASFACSTVWVPIFGSRTIWLSQLVIIALVVCLVMTVRRLQESGAASGPLERVLLRLPVTVYLGWATLATAAGFGLTFRSLGVPAAGTLITIVSLLLVLVATGVSVWVVTRFNAAAGFAFTACWALVAIAVATYAGPVRVGAVVALLLILVVLGLRTARSRHPGAVLFG